ncbi:hypothetical protein BOQ62_07280 [Chryseobacterium sp. CH21]|nr:hypothetical protein BOQ62_07280 [Chryseobacterium sp. CH21]
MTHFTKIRKKVLKAALKISKLDFEIRLTVSFVKLIPADKNDRNISLSISFRGCLYSDAVLIQMILFKCFYDHLVENKNNIQ